MERVKQDMQKFTHKNKLAANENFVNRQTLFTSGYYSISDFNCYSNERLKFKPGYTPEFCINFARKGYFTFDSFRRSYEEYNSRILVEKPGCEYILTQPYAGPGACTIFRFTENGYEEIKEKYKLRQSSFFADKNIYSLVLAATPESDYLHHAILKTLGQPGYCLLELDILVMEFIDVIMNALTGNSLHAELPQSSKRYHIATIERAKEYILENFTDNISLNELSQHCYVSPFYFSRLFKQLSTCSPFYYLQHIRLKHAETMIRTTDLPLTDICFRSGFNRLDYFSTAFTKKYAISPSRYKLGFS